MKLAIMQPYFLPYLGYYSLIKYADRFVLFDTAQFMRHGWIERNRILKPAEGWQYISVPVDRESMRSPIKEVHIRNDPDWKARIFRQLEHYKKRAPFYPSVIGLLDEALDERFTSITRLNHRVLAVTCEYLGIHRDIAVLSDMGLKITEPVAPGEWALRISQALGASEYVNPPGGVELFDQEQYRSAGVPIVFLKNNLGRYDQKRTAFEPGLSIVDVLMFNDPESANKLIDDYAESGSGAFPEAV